MAKAAKKNPDEMSFLDHLEELRWHLIRSTIAVVIIASITLLIPEFIFDTVLLGPKSMDFPTYRFFCKVGTFIGIDSNFCADELPLIIQNREMSGQFSIYIWTAIWAGFIIGFPYILYEMWKFISPGLHQNERKHSRGFILSASLLFFSGALFGYYLVAPLSINFLGTFTVSAQVTNNIDISSFVGTVRTSVIACGLIFELPIIVYFLTKVGLVTPAILKKYRKISLVVVLILAAVVTPPDVVSQILVALPILGLYQISIYISKRVLKNEAKKEAKLAAQRAKKS
jgi:sec-independent protein translocase protein TatC